MAIDSSIFAADLPAGTYAVGDVVQLKNVQGPSVVRSGRGAAILKRITAFMITSQSGSLSFWKIFVKNSDWIDPAESLAANLDSKVALDRRTGAVQSGNNCPLNENSSWEVWAECYSGGTTTVDNSIGALIDVDYPSVSSIIDPDALTGYPSSIEDKRTGLTINAPGTIESASWTTFNVDIFKAGYEYALVKPELTVTMKTNGFIALSNAAGMGGLTRMIPMNNDFDTIRIPIEYATKLRKGPMDIKYLMFNNAGSTATTANATLILDFVKRRLA